MAAKKHRERWCEIVNESHVLCLSAFGVSGCAVTALAKAYLELEAFPSFCTQATSHGNVKTQLEQHLAIAGMLRVLETRNWGKVRKAQRGAGSSDVQYPKSVCQATNTRWCMLGAERWHAASNEWLNISWQSCLHVCVCSYEVHSCSFVQHAYFKRYCYPLVAECMYYLLDGAIYTSKERPLAHIDKMDLHLTLYLPAAGTVSP